MRGLLGLYAAVASVAKEGRCRLVQVMLVVDSGTCTCECFHFMYTLTFLHLKAEYLTPATSCFAHLG